MYSNSIQNGQYDDVTVIFFSTSNLHFYRCVHIRPWMETILSCIAYQPLAVSRKNEGKNSKPNQTKTSVTKLPDKQFTTTNTGREEKKREKSGLT